MLASALSSRPGASAIFAGGIVAYSNLLKHRLLSVDASILDVEHGGPGEVSKECALAMAQGVLRNSGLLAPEHPKAFEISIPREKEQGIAISTTGYLQGGPPGKEGEVWIGCYWVFQGKEGSRVKQMWMSRDKNGAEPVDEEAERNVLKDTVVQAALQLVVGVMNELNVGGSK